MSQATLNAAPLGFGPVIKCLPWLGACPFPRLAGQRQGVLWRGNQHRAREEITSSRGGVNAPDILMVS